MTVVGWAGPVRGDRWSRHRSPPAGHRTRLDVRQTMAKVEVSTPAGVQSVVPAKLSGFLPSAPPGWSPAPATSSTWPPRAKLNNRRARPSPGSSANLGPGFDVLALALALYVEVEIVPARAALLVQRGGGVGLACDGQHLAAELPRRSAVTTVSRSGSAPRSRSGRARLVRGPGGGGRGRRRSARPLQGGRRLRGPPRERGGVCPRWSRLCGPPRHGPGPPTLPARPGTAFVVLVPDRELLTDRGEAGRLSPM